MNETDVLPTVADTGEAEEAPTHVVAIGASAGGLEPIELLFDQLPATTGAAFVLIQHLSPDFKSLMDQLLARHTSMEIVRVTDRTRIRRDRVYLLPPRKEMIVSGGELLLRDRDVDVAVNLPIDVFLRSLAAEYADRAVAVILSGSGSDGARGCLAVQESGGLVVAQAPSTANFPSMPQAVLDQVVSAHRAASDEMAKLIARHVAGTPPRAAAGSDVDGVANPTQRILFALRQRFGPDFGYYKPSTVARRIERRLGLSKSADLESYVAYLLDHPDEMETLYHDLLIGVTGFFRDEAAFRAFEKEALPGLVERMRAGEQVRVWVAGCATGEEVYSLAILLLEAAAQRQIAPNLKIFATDIHERSLAHASEGVYAGDKVMGIDAARLARFFEPLDNGDFRVKPAVRRFVVFSKHNLIKDPPFSRLHLISCRNLLIYLGDAAQRKVMALFHFSLRKSGLLFLGSSETPGRLADEFSTVNARFRLFRKLRDVRLSASLELLPPSMVATERPDEPQALASTPGAGAVALFRQLMPAYDTLLATYAPPGLLIDHVGHIVHVFGDAGRYLRPIAEGAVSMRAADRVHEALHVAVSSGIDRALRHGTSSAASDVALPLEGGHHEHVDVQVTPIATRQGDDPAHVFVGFVTGAGRRSGSPASAEDPETVVIAPDEAARRIRDLETDLRLTEESLQTTIEELETSNEELQAANEELQSSNEELQSTNEELYSINEELHTVSGEYEHRIEELVQLNSDMNNLLTSTDIGAIFLDRELNLRRFTPAAAKLFHLVPHDVGRPISHVTSRIVSADLQEDIARIQGGHPRIEREVTTDTDARYIVRLLPYTTAEGRPDGVSLSFVDVGELKRTYAELKQRNLELAEANEELERFAYIASHDLKAPVRGCSHVLGFLRDDLDGRLTAEQSGQFDAAIARLRHMETMLRELLDYARLGQEDPAREAVDVAKLLRETVALLQPPAGFEVQVRAPLPAIHGAPGLVALVFRNLLGNALKHHHGDRGTIIIHGEVKGGRAEFFVSDDGPGIDPAMHRQIFEPFRKLDPNGGGTGMGLAFVKRALERASGAIEIIASGPGQGTTFRVILPVRPEPGSAEAG